MHLHHDVGFFRYRKRATCWGFPHAVARGVASNLLERQPGLVAGNLVVLAEHRRLAVARPRITRKQTISVQAFVGDDAGLSGGIREPNERVVYHLLVPGNKTHRPHLQLPVQVQFVNHVAVHVVA